MKALPIVLLGLAVAVAAAAFFVPARVYVTIGHQITSVFSAKKAAPPVKVLSPAPKPIGVAGAPVPLALEQVQAISPEVIAATNGLIDTIKNGLGTLATLITVLLGMKQLKPVQEKRRAAKAAKKASEPEKPKKTGLKVTSRPR